MKRLIFSVLIGGASVLLFTSSSNAQDGEQIFKQNCMACHKMGMRLVGPDLTGVTERRSADWIKSFIENSQAMIAAGDAEAVAIFEEFNKVPMTPFPLSDGELNAVVDYLAGFGSKAEASDEAPAEAVEEAPAEYTEENVADGKAYFQGGRRFAGGGPSCVACHNVTNEEVMPGGLMAKDLTNSYGRMGGHAGVTAILGAPPFPAMTNAYTGDAALTEEEIHAVAAFLKTADDASDQEEAGFAGMAHMLLFGIGGLFVILILVALTWSGRIRQSVKHDINKRQLRSI